MIETIAAPDRLPRLLAVGLAREASQDFLATLAAWEGATDLHAVPQPET